MRRMVEFVVRAGAHPIARIVKIADIEDHLDGADAIPESMVRRYKRAMEILK